MKEFIRPLPAHSIARIFPPPASINSYVNNPVIPRTPAGPPWFNKLLKVFKLELVKL